MPIVWRSEMSIDGGMIDADHRCLIEIINAVEAVRPGPSMPNEVVKTLAELSAYAQLHFGREQKLQDTVRFTYARAHLQRHRALLRDLDGMRAEWEKTRSPREVVAFHAQLCRFLYDWLIDHICKVDVLMKPFVDEMRGYTTDVVPLTRAAELGTLGSSQAQGAPHRQLPLAAR